MQSEPLRVFPLWALSTPKLFTMLVTALEKRMQHSGQLKVRPLSPQVITRCLLNCLCIRSSQYLTASLLPSAHFSSELFWTVVQAIKAGKTTSSLPVRANLGKAPRAMAWPLLERSIFFRMYFLIRLFVEMSSYLPGQFCLVHVWKIVVDDGFRVETAVLSHVEGRCRHGFLLNGWVGAA